MPEAHCSLSAKASLVLLPAYLGTHSIAEAIKTARGQRILWLEILVNDHLDLSPWTSDPSVQNAYQMACRWYTHYRRLLTSLLDRTPLPSDQGPIDYRDYRTFAGRSPFVCTDKVYSRYQRSQESTCHL